MDLSRAVDMRPEKLTKICLLDWFLHILFMCSCFGIP